MIRYILILALFFFSAHLIAQDAYHAEVQDFLTSNYNASGGTWIFSDTEADNNEVDANWGGSFDIIPASNQLFSSAISVAITTPGGNPWDAGILNSNTVAINQGDIVFCTFYIRTTQGPGDVSVVIEDGVTFNKEFAFEASVPAQWTRYFVKFEAQDSYAIGALNFGFQYGTQAQSIEIGGFTALNFGTNVLLDQLPIDIHNDRYGGWEADAPWRAQAAQRIQSLRTANLTIDARDQNGNPVANGSVEVKMKEHNFKFGTAVNACRFAGNFCQNDNFESKLNDLDGEGHGFNMIVFENDTKWPNWEDENASSRRDEIIKCVDWCAERGIETRGHTLVWPGNNVLPQDIEASQDLDYIKERLDFHIEEILNYPNLKGKIVEWDVLNEVVTNRDLEGKFAGNGAYQTGREIYKEIFDKAKQVDPAAKLFLNDFVTLSVNDNENSPLYIQLKQFLSELIDAGAPVEGIGFQGHIGAFPNSIYDVEATLDDFYDTYNLPAKITEFDLPDVVTEEIAATYLKDFMTMIYSHPSMEGFMFWSFWDGAFYMNPGANLFRQDWSMTPAGEAFTDLLFKEWWTEEEVMINNGLASVNGYKGTYEVSYICNGVIETEEINLTSDLTLNIVCDNLSTSTLENFIARFSIYPNPSTGVVTVSRNSSRPTRLNVFNTLGQLVITQEVNGVKSTFNIVTPGVYIISVDGLSQKLLIE